VGRFLRHGAYRIAGNLRPIVKLATARGVPTSFTTRVVLLWDLWLLGDFQSLYQNHTFVNF